MPPHERTSVEGVAQALDAIARRLLWQALLRGAAIGLPVAAVCTGVARWLGAGSLAASAIGLLALAMLTLVLFPRKHVYDRAAAARTIEVAHPECRNVVITAEELLRHPERASSPMVTRVLTDSGRIASRVDGAHVVPMAPSTLIAGGALVLSMAIAAGVPVRIARTIAETARQVSDRVSGQPQKLAVKATIEPPSYTGRPATTVQNPERIDALAGSRLVLSVAGGASPWRVRFGADVIQPSTGDPAGSISLVLRQSGYLAIEPTDGADSAPGRLVPVSVQLDRAPTIEVKAPGKDLLLPDAKPVIPLTASASDDIGLRSLELKYTKVSGSGEQYDFVEGTLPLAITRDADTQWRANAELALSTLQLNPGDAMIYRVVGHDARPGEAGQGSSETFFIEIAGPGQVALAGFEMPPDRDRYALSQQMIVLKLERLRARERTIDRQALEEEVANIAAEQRAVRANFVFLMGGQVEDEEEEAEHSHEIQEGRLENTARREISVAINYMGKVESGLAAVNTGEALPPAKAAVEALQRAFGRNRYFLRTLPVRSRIDPSRRLTGETKAASDWRRDLSPAERDAIVIAATTLRSRLVEMGAQVSDASFETGVLTGLAETALATDPGAADWQAIAQALLKLRDAAPAARPALLADAVTRVTTVAERGVLSVESFEADRRNRSLRGAWTEEQRR